MTFEEYVATEQAKYARLAEIIESILISATKTRSDLRLQHTQRRAKEPDSLERKLKRDGHLNAIDIETHAKDLAGCRLVFYTNSDVSAFLSSGIVVENFEVDWDRTKIHHPSRGSDSAAEQFVSNNYVVRLKADRAGLPEYSSVAGLWCEVQVQTTLNHAWAEMAHDTIYKKPDLPGGFGASLMEEIETRMADIMRKHLLPAGYEFQKVLSDFERLSTGKDLFDRGALEAITGCDDNNCRHDLLQRFSRYVLPHYDDVAGVHDEICSALSEVVTAARASDTKPIETPFGTLPGHSGIDVINVAADILDRIRYADIERTFAFLVEMGASTSSEETARWVKSAEELAKHELQAWEKVGPAVQFALLRLTKLLPSDKKQAARPVLVAMLEKMLETEITGSAAHFDRIVFSRGSIPFSQSVRKLRRTAIRLLKLMALTAKSPEEKRVAFSALHEAARGASGPGVSHELQAELLENACDVIDFYSRNFALLDYAQQENLEHRVLWVHRHTREATGNDPEAISLARSKLADAIVRFRSAINADERFVRYKTLVGYESVFEPAWDDYDFDISAIDEYRSRRIDEFVDAVDESNAAQLLELIKDCASTSSNDLATFPKFGEFLQKLAAKKPDIALSFLKAEEDVLAGFLTSILLGLEQSGREADLKAEMQKWAEEGKFLRPIIWAFRAAKTLDLELLDLAFTRARDLSDGEALHNVLTVADARNHDVENGLVERLLLPAIEKLDSMKDHVWPRAVWGRREQSTFHTLTEAQAKRVLNALLQMPRLDWHEEDVLGAIGKHHPRLVVDFFGDRLAERKRSDGRYGAIPFQFYQLHEILLPEGPYVVQSARTWFESDAGLFAYLGGKFVHNVFAGSWTTLEPQLRTLIDGSGCDLAFIVQILRTFEGESFLHPLIKDLVERVPADSDLLDEIESALDESGVVAGEFGFVELYESRRDEMVKWLDDDRPSVRDFAAKHVRALERRIAAEQRRAQEDYELRRRNWGAPDEGPEDQPGGAA